MSLFSLSAILEVFVVLLGVLDSQGCLPQVAPCVLCYRKQAPASGNPPFFFTSFFAGSNVGKESPIGILNSQTRGWRAVPLTRQVPPPIRQGGPTGPRRRLAIPVAPRPTFWFFLSSRRQRIVVRMNLVCIPEDLVGSAGGYHAETQKEVRGWINQLWAEKDETNKSIHAQSLLR